MAKRDAAAAELDDEWALVEVDDALFAAMRYRWPRLQRERVRCADILLLECDGYFKPESWLPDDSWNEIVNLLTSLPTWVVLGHVSTQLHRLVTKKLHHLFHSHWQPYIHMLKTRDWTRYDADEAKRFVEVKNRFAGLMARFPVYNNYFLRVNLFGEPVLTTKEAHALFPADMFTHWANGPTTKALLAHRTFAALYWACEHGCRRSVHAPHICNAWLAKQQDPIILLAFGMLPDADGDYLRRETPPRLVSWVLELVLGVPEDVSNYMMSNFSEFLEAFFFGESMSKRRLPPNGTLDAILRRYLNMTNAQTAAFIEHVKSLVKT